MPPPVSLDAVTAGPTPAPIPAPPASSPLADAPDILLAQVAAALRLEAFSGAEQVERLIRRVRGYPTGPERARLCVVLGAPSGAVPPSPWVGEGGALLARMIGAMHLDPAAVLALTLVEDTAADRGAGPLHGLHAAGVEVVLVFGAHPASLLFGQPVEPASWHGRWHVLDGLPTVVTHAPEALIATPSLKRPTWQSMQAVMRRLKL